MQSSKRNNVPTLYYNGHSKDRKSMMRLSMNKRYVTIVQKRNRTSSSISLAATTSSPSTTSIIDRISFIDWHMIKRIQLHNNHIKIVSKNNLSRFKSKKSLSIKAYFDQNVLKYLKNNFKKVDYLKPVNRKRKWYSFIRTILNINGDDCNVYQPIIRQKRKHTRTDSGSSQMSMDNCLMMSSCIKSMNNRTSSSSSSSSSSLTSLSSLLSSNTDDNELNGSNSTPDRSSIDFYDDSDDDDWNDFNDNDGSNQSTGDHDHRGADPEPNHSECSWKYEFLSTKINDLYRYLHDSCQQHHQQRHLQQQQQQAMINNNVQPYDPYDTMTSGYDSIMPTSSSSSSSMTASALFDTFNVNHSHNHNDDIELKNQVSNQPSIDGNNNNDDGYDDLIYENCKAKKRKRCST